MSDEEQGRVEKARRTVRLTGIPEHHTTEGRVGRLGLLGNRNQSVDSDVAASSGGRISRSTDVDLDVLVRRGGLRPVVPARKSAHATLPSE